MGENRNLCTAARGSKIIFTRIIPLLYVTSTTKHKLMLFGRVYVLIKYSFLWNVILVHGFQWWNFADLWLSPCFPPGGYSSTRLLLVRDRALWEVNACSEPLLCKRQDVLCCGFSVCLFLSWLYIGKVIVYVFFQISQRPLKC